jgi:hypothetical protein
MKPLSTKPASKKARKRKPAPTRAQRLAALAAESELALRDQIRRLLALPMEKRMNFLRVRVGYGSAL